MPGRRTRSNEAGRSRVWEAIGALAAAVASLVAVAGLVVANRGDEASGATADNSAETTTDAADSATGAGGGGSDRDSSNAAQSENVDTGREDTTTSDTTPEDPAGPDLALFLEPSCSIVGSGGLSGDDVMTFFFRARNVGEDAYDGAVRATAVSDSGLQGSSTGGAADGPASSFVQVELAPQDYGRTHTFTIEVEATEDLDETDLDNNLATIDVSLPDEPPGTGDTIDPCE